MTLAPAPLYEDIAGGPAGGAAYWAKTSDGVQIRAGYWPCDGAKGTLLLFPGRTEYIEKYGRTASELAQIGIATVTVDWRGQGLADRLYSDRRLGHIGRFSDFQKDVTAVMEVVRALDVPGPLHVLGHSMGGAIGLRAVMNGLPVSSCVFTGPMWGIRLSAVVRPFGWLLPRLAKPFGLATTLAPSTKLDFYVQANPFEGNMLTTDRDMYEYMQAQLAAHPDLGLGGPSLNWLRESLDECASLARLPSPDLPCVTFLGENEQIIDCPAVHDRMERWPGGEMIVVPTAEHEVLMETPAIRADVMRRMATLFETSAQAAA